MERAYRCGAAHVARRPVQRHGSATSVRRWSRTAGVGAARPRDDIEAGDRRIVTALFADLVDYVRLVAEHDPEDVRRKVDAALRAMVEAIQAYDGTREKFIGDAVFAVFGWPHGHEDDAQRAAHCALAIREALATAAGPAGEPLRSGSTATGEVVAGLRTDDGLDWSLTGPAVTTAARIQAMARPGEILLDEATVQATRKALQVEDIGPQLLRGQIQPIRVARLLGEAGFQPGGRRPGGSSAREAERARLADRRRPRPRAAAPRSSSRATPASASPA